MSSHPPISFSFSISNIFFFLTLVSSSSSEFVYNSNFNSTNTLLFGNATIESSILTLTNQFPFSVGRAFYPLKVPTRSADNSFSFSTSFIFSIAPFKNVLPGHGFVFILTPHAGGTNGVSSAQHLGLFNLTNNGNPKNHVFGVEFDVFKNQEFNDINDNHVGVDINSLTSVTSHAAGFWGGVDDEKFEDLKLNDGENYQVWIDYLGVRLNVTMTRAGRKRPHRPLISETVNLSNVLLDEMFVGFCGATGQLVESHRILAWSFSNSNFSIGDALITMNLPSFEIPKGSVLRSRGFMIGITLGVLFVIGSAVMIYAFWFRRKRRNRKRGEEDIEDWELEYWPHRIGYEDIYAATKGFSDQNVIGHGGNGKVYKGLLQGVEVAVKRIPYDCEYGMREFLSEVSSLGRLKHRNVVPLRGWCKKERGNLILVYDYMENGSLDKRIHDEGVMLRWEERIKVLKDVAQGMLYLHEGWEVKVLHRDIKASNVLLDRYMNAKLGDFGLAKMHHHHHEHVVNTSSRVIGTVGYMAPEIIKNGSASTQTDVFSFGVLVLEVVCGRRPSEENKSLVGWVWRVMERGEFCSALDERLKGVRDEECSIDEVERVLHLGLLCAHPEPHVRPTMRQVVNVLEGENMDMSLVEKINSAAEYGGSVGGSFHPSFEDVFSSHCSFTTECGNEGR